MTLTTPLCHIRWVRFVTVMKARRDDVPSGCDIGSGLSPFLLHEIAVVTRPNFPAVDELPRLSMNYFNGS
jgi:hypothetical protein